MRIYFMSNNEGLPCYIYSTPIKHISPRKLIQRNGYASVEAPTGEIETPQISYGTTFRDPNPPKAELKHRSIA